MKIAALSITLMLSSLCEARASLSLLFGLSVSVSCLCSDLFSRAICFCSTVKIQLISKVLVSSSAALAFSELTGAVFSGDVDVSFCAVCGTAGVLLSILSSSYNVPRFFSTILMCCLIIPSALAVGVLRELVGYGTLFGKEVSFMSHFTVGSLRSYFGGLLAVSAVMAVMFLIIGRERRKNEA